MGKAFQVTGFFLIGVSVAGVFSYSAYAYELLRMYGFWLSVVTALALFTMAICDDFFASILGLSYPMYVGGLISLIAVLVVGGVVQWVR